MNAIKVLSFDLDDTLWPIGPVIQNAENELFDWLDRNCPRAIENHSVESMRELRVQVSGRFPDRVHDLSFMRRQALREQLGAAGYGDEVAEAAFQIFFSARNRIQLFPDVEPALVRLRKSYRLFALSNGNADLHRCGVAQHFEGHVSARSAGSAKPDSRIFEHLVTLAAVGKDQIMHVGDDPLADVHGAIQSGLQAAWICREPRSWPAHLQAPALTVTSLAELR